MTQVLLLYVTIELFYSLEEYFESTLKQFFKKLKVYLAPLFIKHEEELIEK